MASDPGDTVTTLLQTGVAGDTPVIAGNRCSVLAFSSAVKASLTCQAGYHQFVPFARQYHHRITLHTGAKPCRILRFSFLQQTPEALWWTSVSPFLSPRRRTSGARRDCNAKPNASAPRKANADLRQTFGLREVDAFWRSIKIQTASNEWRS